MLSLEDRRFARRQHIDLGLAEIPAAEPKRDLDPLRMMILTAELKAMRRDRDWWRYVAFVLAGVTLLPSVLMLLAMLARNLGWL